MRMALTICYTAFHPAYFTRSCEKGPGNGRILEFRSERKKRTTSGGCPQFPKRFSGNLPFHLTSNRNFQIFWLNGKHPSYPPALFELPEHVQPIRISFVWPVGIGKRLTVKLMKRHPS